MVLRIGLSVALLVTVPAWPQLGVVPYQTSATPADESLMQTPPPVSGASYPTSVGAETRSNYLGGGLMLNIAHGNNVIAVDNATPTSDTIYTISPTISLDKSTLRQHLSLTYSPGFTLYQNVSSLDTVAQSATINFHYRWTEHTSLNLADSLQKTSNVFDQLYPPSGDQISASVQAPPTQVTAPYASLLRNDVYAGITHQMSRDSMFGVSGSATDSTYPNPDQALAFYNSNSRGGSIFYSRRLSERTYLGTIYQYVQSQGNSPADSTRVATEIQVQTHTIAAFYTIYLSRTVSLSVASGPQYYDAIQLPFPAVRSWAPFVVAGVGWQKRHTNLAASYSKAVTANSGLSEPVDSAGANASWSWQISRSWSMDLGGVYFIDTPIIGSSSLGAHTISGTVSVRHYMGEHLHVDLGYARLHQSYSDVTVISVNPNRYRTYISISYQWSRPLGR